MKSNRCPAVLLVLGLAVASPAAHAQAPAEMSLTALLASAADRLDRRFLPDARAPESVVVGDVETADLDYAALLGVLRNNGLAAVEIDGYVNVVRIDDIRQYALPIVEADDDVAGDEWVTSVIDVGDFNAATLVPVLRPLLPQQAHLAAHSDTNRLIIVDRFANVRRIESIVASMR